MEAYEGIEVLARVLNPPCPDRFNGRVAVASAESLHVEFTQFIQPSTLIQMRGKNGCFLGEVLSCSPSETVKEFMTVIRIEDYFGWQQN